MATEREEIILDIQVNQGDLNDQLVETRKSIEQVRKAQQELRKEYIAGTKDVDEYTKETIELERSLKREQENYKNLTKAIDTNSNSLNAQRQRLIALKRERDNLDRSTKEGAKQFEKLTNQIKQLNDAIKESEEAGGDFGRNVGNYGEAVKDAASKINIAGVSVGDLSGKLTAFLNPATAAVGVVAALGAVYAKSTTGARDLQFATDKLTSVFSIITEDIGRLVGGPDGGGGEGLFSKLTDKYLQLIQFVPIIKGLDLVTDNAVSDYIENLRKKADEAAKALERLRELQISLAFARGFQKEDERQAELQRRIRDDETKSLRERIAATDQLSKLLEGALDKEGRVINRTVVVLQSQIKAIKESTANFENNREAQQRVAELESEILDEQERINGMLTENVTARRAIVKALEEQLQLEEFIRREQGAPDTDVTRSTVDVSGSPLVDQERLEGEAIFNLREKLNNDLLDLNNRLYIQEVQQKREAAEAKRQIEEQSLGATSAFINATSQLFEQESVAYKALALSQNYIDTYRAATSALTDPPTGAGPLFGPILAAATIVRGLANAQKIIGFESGGYTGTGRSNQPAGIVHKNEVVFNAQDVSMLGGPSVVDAMRPTHRSRRSRGFGYQDGGVVVNSQLQNANQSLAVMDMIRNMPNPVVGVKEFNQVSRKVSVKESLSRRG